MSCLALILRVKDQGSKTLRSFDHHIYLYHGVTVTASIYLFILLKTDIRYFREVPDSRGTLTFNLPRIKGHEL